MKPLILLTAMTVIGLFGIIGTVEYAHAQTPLTIEPINNSPASSSSPQLISKPTWNAAYTNTPNHPFHYGEGSIGDIHIPRNTKVDDPIFVNITSNISCNMKLESVSSLLTDYPNHVERLNAPDNITPKTNDTIVAIGLDIFTQANQRLKCTPNLEAPSKQYLIPATEIQIKIYNKHDKKPYYFSPRHNILEAQPIPICTTDNFNTTDKTLKGDTKMCYGKNGNNMVIVSKRLMGFYGAADSITTPTNPIALDSNVVETQKEYDEKIKREKDYLALLERLYLPAI